MVSNYSGVILAVPWRCPKDRFLGEAMFKPPRQEVSTASVKVSWGGSAN